MSKLDWRIYYDHGAPFDNLQGAHTDAPAWGVQVINQRDNDLGVRRHDRKDYFIFVDGKWVGVDFVGMLDHVANVLGVVKVGRMLQPDEFRRIYQEAVDDADFPPKSAYDQRENRY